MLVSFREADTPLQNSTAGSTESTSPKQKGNGGENIDPNIQQFLGSTREGFSSFFV